MYMLPLPSLYFCTNYVTYCIYTKNIFFVSNKLLVLLAYFNYCEMHVFII